MGQNFIIYYISFFKNVKCGGWGASKKIKTFKKNIFLKKSSKRKWGADNPLGGIGGFYVRVLHLSLGNY